MSDPVGVRLRIDDVEQTITIEEALILKDRLEMTPSLAARDLGHRLDEHLENDPLDVPFDLDPADAMTVRFVLVDAELNDYPGLATVRTTLRDLQPPPGELS
jgi:hypothetical protein